MTGDITTIVKSFVEVINLMVGMLSGIAFVLFLAGGARYMFKAGGKNSGERSAMMWSLVALFILVSVWGILNLMSLSLFGTSGGVNDTGSGSRSATFGPTNSISGGSNGSAGADGAQSAGVPLPPVRPVDLNTVKYPTPSVNGTLY